ncbi:MAG TPA: DUF2461 domain-containing protein [Caulobacteraceae bacterium]|nr:DUF2461 domain-containing protein [Caulobacteraceae bacterium]
MAKAETQATTGITPFDGFSPQLFEFFEALSANQTRDWFQANKAAYERHVRAPMASFVESLALAFAAHDIPLTGSAERSLFRINRDVRFSKDKRPYKTNVAALLTRDGTKQGKGVFYISLGGHHEGVDRRGMIGAGFYAPEPPDLTALRTAIAKAPERWLETEAALAAAGLACAHENALARLPKGFESFAGSPVADALKLKGLHVWTEIPTKRLYTSGLIDNAVEFARAAQPLLEFGWSALARAAR